MLYLSSHPFHQLCLLCKGIPRHLRQVIYRQVMSPTFKGKANHKAVKMPDPRSRTSRSTLTFQAKFLIFLLLTTTFQHAYARPVTRETGSLVHQAPNVRAKHQEMNLTEACDDHSKHCVLVENVSENHETSRDFLF